MNDRTESPAWDDLRYFLALVQSGSLMAASRDLGVEHSTVARRVTALETVLGVRLFDRLPRGWRPTPEGQQLVTHAQTVEREVAALVRNASGLDTMAGEVRISAPPVLLSMLVIPGLAGLMQTCPGLIPILIGTRHTSDLSRAEADIALRMGTVTGPDLILRKLGVVRYGLYGRADQIARPAPERVYLGFDDSMPDLPQAQWLQSRVQAERARTGLRSNDMASLIAAARAGAGIALLPCFVHHTCPDLVQLADDAPFEPRPLYLVTHPDLRRAPRVQMVSDYLVKTLSGVLA